MPTVYGSDDAYALARADVASEITDLIAAMVTAGTDPRFAAVYAGHTSTAPMSFPCATVGIAGGLHKMPALHSSPAGPATRTIIGIEIRVLLGYAPTYFDDLKIGRLFNSTLNWLNEHRTLDNGEVVTDDITTAMTGFFDDTDTIGGIIRLDVMMHQAFTAA